MIHDSMEFFDMYRSRLQEARCAAPRLRMKSIRSPRRRGHSLARLCGRVLLASGQLLATVGERLSGGEANGRVPSNG